LQDLGSRIIRGVRSSIATRLSLYLVIIIALSGLLFTIVGVKTISNLIVAEAEDRVRNDLNTARLIYQGQLDQISQAAEFTAARTFIDAILLDNAVDQGYINELTRFKVDEGLDILTFTDANGIVVLRVNNPGYNGDDISNQPLISAVLRTETLAAGTVIMPVEDLQNESPHLAEQAYFVFIDTPMAIPRAETEEKAGMMLMAAIPVFDDRGAFIGIVYAGTLINRNYDIVDKVKQTVFQNAVYKGNDIGTATIFQKDVRISTNVKNGDGSRAIGTRIAADVYEQVVVNGEQWVGRAYVVNDWYISAYEPIKNTNNEIIGILYVGILEQKYTDINNRAVLVFSGITITGVVLSIFFALLISRGISSSIKNLATASKQLANGNLETKVSKVSNDELGDLADTFNTMADALKDRDEKLKEYAKKKIMESERLALIGQLSANVAHELNNPLQGIVTYSYLLLEDESCNEDSKVNLQKIVIQANRCRDIIRGLLDFSRQKKPDKTLCSINSMLQGCISLIEKQAIFQNILIAWNLDEDLPRIILDPSQVERVFINLFVNAAEAMDGNGQLTITTKHYRKKKMIEIKVQDTGHGISQENINKIFDPFFTTKDTGHGVGLGLAISYGIVKEHGGNLKVESELEKGTTFTVSFPLTASETGKVDGQ
jgi:two-component system, NtrC family, sensor kinase